MKNRSCQGSICMSLPKDVDEMLRVSGASGSDHWNPHGIRHGARQFAVEARTCSVSVHRSQQYFARAERLYFPCPLDYVAPSLFAASMAESRPTGMVAASLRVNRDDHCLRPKALCNVGDQSGIG